MIKPKESLKLYYIDVNARLYYQIDNIIAYFFVLDGKLITKQRVPIINSTRGRVTTTRRLLH